MNEADRVAAAKVKAQIDEQNRAKGADNAARRDVLDDLYMRARAAIPQALAAHARRQYDGIIQVSYDKKGVFGSKEAKMGGWLLASFKSGGGWASQPPNAYLMRDGSICLYSWKMSLTEYYDQCLRQAGLGRKPAIYGTTFHQYTAGFFEQIVIALEKQATQ